MKVITVQPFDLDVYVTSNKIEAIDWITKNYSDHETFEETINSIKHDRGIFHDFGTDSAILLYYTDNSSLDHEIIHATWKILNYVGIPINHEEHEIQCYLFEHIKKLILNQ